MKNTKLRLVYTIIPAVLLLAGIILIVVGIYQDELHEILQKGTVVCLECIAIG